MEIKLLVQFHDTEYMRRKLKEIPKEPVALVVDNRTSQYHIWQVNNPHILWANSTALIIISKENDEDVTVIMERPLDA